MKPIKFFYTTRHGTFFHLTPTNFSVLDIRNALVSVGDFAHMDKVLETMQSQKISFKKYLGLDDLKHTTYLTSVDHYKNRCIEGSQLQMTVKLMQNIGYRLYTIDQHNKLGELIQPDILVSLTETPPEADDQESKLKSNKRAVEKSLFFLEKTLQYFKDKVYKPTVYAAIQGGLNAELRSLAVYYTIQTCFKEHVPLYSNFGGLVFYGFQESDDWADKDETMERAFEEVPAELKDDLSYVLAGKGDLLSVIWGISWGFDGFEIEEPFSKAEKAIALFLPSLNQSLDLKELEKYQGDPLHFFELQGKAIQTQSYPMDDAPHLAIDQFCQCFTCKNHTILYITHLVQCREMNAQVLLSIHNTHQYQLFHKILSEMRERKLQNQWLRWFLSTLQVTQS